MPYKLTNCLWCGDLFKDFPPGYIGDGRKGILGGFYSIKEFEGYCSADCFICDGNHYSPKDNSFVVLYLNINGHLTDNCLI